MKTNEKVHEKLNRIIAAAKQACEAAKAYFINETHINPAKAVEWNAEDMIKAQTEYDVWLGIAADLQKEEPGRVLENAYDELQSRVRSFFGSNSTSIFHNAVERARAEAFLRQAEKVGRLIDCINDSE